MSTCLPPLFSLTDQAHKNVCPVDWTVRQIPVEVRIGPHIADISCFKNDGYTTSICSMVSAAGGLLGHGKPLAGELAFGFLLIQAGVNLM